jgi:transposase
MVSALPQGISSAELTPGKGRGSTPFAQQTVELTKQAYIQLKWAVKYWRAQYQRALAREAALKAEVEAQQATIRDLRQRLYGTQSEKTAGPNGVGESPAGSLRQRGQQPGSPGHGRSSRSALPEVGEVQELSAVEQHCPVCGAAFLPFPGTEASTIIEVQVQAYVRRIHRQRYRKGCQCSQVAGILTAPPAPRLLPKSPLGVSVWGMVLLDKYLYGRPTHRLCEELSHYGLPLAQGTLTDGLRRLGALFEPVGQALRERQMSEELFHGDETRWEVFEEVQGKVGHRWYLWVTRSASVVCYQMAPGRGAEVPKAYFAGLHQEVGEVVLVCDRYSAYKGFAKGQRGIILAYCWAHVRRDFLQVARSWPELESWGVAWVADIRALYRLNTARVEVWDETVAVEEQPPAFGERQRALTSHLSAMRARCEEQLRATALHRAQKKVLTSLHKHWAGLTVFVQRPAVAMDNNAAERALRLPVTGRKNYYGSGSVWSAQLAALLFSVLQTVLLWELNPHQWLTAFLQACADHGGKSPPDLSSFLPWEMTAERRRQLARPVAVTVPTFSRPLQAEGEPEATDTS